MKGARGLLCAAVLLPALLLTGCYKDLEKVRIKPFRPDLVVPLAAADSITVADMLLRDDDMWALDTVGSNGRVQFTYLTRAIKNSSLKLGFVKELTVERVGSGVNRVKEDLFADANHGVIEAVKEITFEQGAKLKASSSVTLTLKDGSTLQLDNITPTELLKDCELDFSTLSDGLKFIFEKPEEKCVKSAVVTLRDAPNTSTMDESNVKLGLYEGLLWYSGVLTDPKVAVTVKRKGWLKEAELECWMENFYFTRKLSVEKEILQRASSSSENFPFYEENAGVSEYHVSLPKGVDSVSETYAIAATNLSTISEKWPISFCPGTLMYNRVAGAPEVTFTKGPSSFNNISASVALKLPLTGKFHALVREFKAGDSDGVVLPDVNELLLKDKEKKDAAVKMKLTDQDTVLLHFYFVNGTPFEVYLAARVAGKNVAERGKPVSSLRKASEIEQNGPSAIDDKVGDFGFFEAVGAAAIDAGQRGITKVGGASKKRVTLAIPYSLYEEARKAQTEEAKRLRAMLLFRSPGDNVPQEVSPRMSDYLSVRLGVEVKPELEIELINKK